MKPLEWDKLLMIRDHCMHGLKRGSVINYSSALKYLKRFNRSRKITSWRQWDGERAVDYVGWLRTQDIGDSWLRSVAEMTFRLIEALQIMDADAVSPDFFIPYAYLPVVSRTYREDDGLRPDVLEKILAATLKEVPVIEKITSLRDLVPFAVLLAMRTGMNADSLYALERDCLVPIEDDFYLIWNKARAGGELRQRHHVEPWGALAVVQRLQTFTGGEFLFSVPALKGNRRIRTLEPDLTAFCLQYGLPQFKLRTMRPAVASWIYKLSNGSAIKVQEFLGHRNIQTTLLYLHEWVVRPQQERALAEGQAAMFERWGISREDQNK